ncbi:Cucumisin [Bertholletia excelsa]
MAPSTSFYPAVSGVVSLFLCFFLAQAILCSSAKVYVVYMGSVDAHDPDEILQQNHQMLTEIHGGSTQQAKASHIYSYRHSFRGFAAKLTEDQASQMAEMPGVVSVFPNTRRKLHTTRSWDFMGMKGEETKEIPGYLTQNQANVIIGFIDTGIWPESPSFHDDLMPPVPATWKGKCQTGQAFNTSSCNRKIIGAKYYLSGYEAEEQSSLKSIVFRSPRDSSGHGSHTASTAAGRSVTDISYQGLGVGRARGGAPRARIAAYKACWDSGCYDADLLAAFDDAIRDGVHIISLSLGPGAPQADYFVDAISIASFHAASEGIVVVASVGNEGSQGSATNLAPWMITVGAGSTDREFTSDIVLGKSVKFTGASLSQLQMNTSARIISASEAYAGYFTPYQSSYCLESSLNSTKARGKVLVCQHAESSAESKRGKSRVVKAAGGVGMILVDEGENDVAIPFVIPAAVVGKRIGSDILSYLHHTRKATSQIFSAKTVFRSQPAPRIAAFSSRGPNALTPEILKPDVTAPGLNILAAWSPANRRMHTNIVSGTSMACPHVTGIVALIKAVQPSWSPSAIKSAIMTTATLLDKNRKLITVDPRGREANAFDYGSGFVNPRRALNPGLVYDTRLSDYKAFLCSIGYNERMLRRITRDNSSCSQTFASPTALNHPSIIVPNLKNKFKVTRTVTNVGKPNSTYKAVVSPPKGVKVTVVPRWLVFSRYGQKMSFTVIFSVAARSEGYQFGYLTWRNRKLRVNMPLIVRRRLA